jgi:uncharacterized protein
MSNNFVHCELTTPNVDTAAGFYKKLFAWKLNKYPGMDYLGINTGSKNSGGGIQKPPMPEAPTGWMPYVEVKDVKKSLAQVAKLGGKVVLPFHPVGDQGAIGVFTDPAGAMLGVYEPAKKKPVKKAAKKKR